MIESKRKNNEKPVTLEMFDSALGTPTTQRLFNILVCWKRLSVKELIEKVNVSETQIYSILKNLEKIGIVEKKSRGIYGLTDSKFSQLLQKAYAENLKKILGTQLYQLTAEIEENTTEETLVRFSKLIRNCDPFLNEHFSHKLSSVC